MPSCAMQSSSPCTRQAFGSLHAARATRASEATRIRSTGSPMGASARMAGGLRRPRTAMRQALQRDHLASYASPSADSSSAPLNNKIRPAGAPLCGATAKLACRAASFSHPSSVPTNSSSEQHSEAAPKDSTASSAGWAAPAESAAAVEQVVQRATATQIREGDVSPVTWACRAGLVCAAISATVWHVEADAAVQSLWDAMRGNAFVQWDSFEPTMVVLSFLTFIGGFWLLDVPLSEHTKRWRLRPEDDGDMRAWTPANWAARLKGETLTYILPLLAIDAVFPRRHLPEDAPALGTLCGEVVLALVLYDLMFTFGHLACHKVPWLYRFAHRKHHSHKSSVRAIETVQLTPSEEVLDVVCSIAALNLLGAHPLSRVVYDVVIVYLLTELHSGYSMPWMLQDVVPGGVWGGSRRHGDHHRLGNVYYQKFFCYLDNAMGHVVRAEEEKEQRGLPVAEEVPAP